MIITTLISIESPLTKALQARSAEVRDVQVRSAKQSPYPTLGPASLYFRAGQLVL